MTTLALDLGTSSVRCVILGEQAVAVPGALARRRTRLTAGPDGTGTLDGPAYLACLLECLDELGDAGHLRDVARVAVCAQWHSLLSLDRAGEPLGPVLTWLDTRPEPLPGQSGPADPGAFHQRTGTWWHRCYWSVRLPWLRQRLAAIRVTGLPEYVLGVLLDDAPMSASQASGTGLLDLRTLTWDAEACDLAGVRVGELPTLAPADWRGRLRPAFARRWPGLAEAAWTAPVGDGAASNVGAACVDPSRAAVTVGTSSAVRVVQVVPAGAALPRLPDRLWRYRLDQDHVVTGAAYSSGGNVFAWADRELRLPRGAELDAALDRVPPDGVVGADPRLGGDRPPGLAPAGSGAVWGLTFATTSVDIVAALMMGVCTRIAEDLVEIESMLEHQVEVVLGGGALAASPWWRRAFAASLSPRSVRHQSDPEIAATGAALLTLGRLAGAAEPTSISRTDDRPSASPAGAWRSRGSP